MIFSVRINDKLYKINLENPVDISIPLDFAGEQPTVFGAEKATAKACETENFVGDTRRGGSCNFEQINFVPHCNGTHTESIGHITNERIFLHNSLKDVFIQATIVSVETETSAETAETYPVKLSAEDRLITKKSLEKALVNCDANFLKGLVVRTLPNEETKKTRDYMRELPPFFSSEAMRFLIEKETEHLFVDTPSIDRLFDEGKLSNHRIFWNVEEGSFNAKSESFVNNTITEMVFVPDSVADGIYLLNLQIVSFNSDAAPSRPIIFRLL